MSDEMKQIGSGEADVRHDIADGEVQCVIDAFQDALQKSGLFAEWGKILNHKRDMTGFHVTVNRVKNDGCSDSDVERLKAENAALRELVVDGYYEEFGDVQSEGAKKEVDRYWRKSTTKQRLEQINGEG